MMPNPPAALTRLSPASRAAARPSPRLKSPTHFYEEPFFYRSRLADLAAKRRLPTMVWANVDAGFLMSYWAHQTDLYRRVGSYVDRILKGAKPGDLPVEQPTRFELAINLKTAKTLGLTIPQSLLRRADQVIE